MLVKLAGLQFRLLRMWKGPVQATPTHGGKAWAFNKDTYDSDPVLQDFVEYYFDHIDEIFL